MNGGGTHWWTALVGALACLVLVPVAARASSSAPPQVAPVDEATTLAPGASVPTTLLPAVTVPARLPPVPSTPQTLLPPVSVPVTLPGVLPGDPSPSAPPAAPGGAGPSPAPPARATASVTPVQGLEGPVTTGHPAPVAPVRPRPLGDDSSGDPGRRTPPTTPALRPLAAQTARQFGFPLLLAALVVAFLAVQHRIDERDDKLVVSVPVGTGSPGAPRHGPAHPSSGALAPAGADGGRASPALVDDDEYVGFS